MSGVVRLGVPYVLGVGRGSWMGFVGEYVAAELVGDGAVKRNLLVCYLFFFNEAR